uniref:Ring finger protein 11 n=1 Tax=Otolemur garnettii TaxID=30611 RepID=H0X5B0_OTOGA
MGNCLKSPTSDDISLLHESQSDRASFGEGTEPDQEPPPPYQVGEALARIEGASGCCPLLASGCVSGRLLPNPRIGVIIHLPRAPFEPSSSGVFKIIHLCVICMMDFVYGDPIRFLPCMHIYHLDCIDDWLMRSFTCPSCMEPVDAALLSSYETN